MHRDCVLYLSVYLDIVLKGDEFLFMKKNAEDEKLAFGFPYLILLQNYRILFQHTARFLSLQRFIHLC